jgi:hypothetical protein
MNPAKPYPAPWTADLADAPESCQIEIFHRETPIAYVRNVDDMEDIGDADPVQVDAEARATALLMAAAPDLLKVAEMFLEQYTLDSYEFFAKYGSTNKVLPIIQKAIAKTRGA